MPETAEIAALIIRDGNVEYDKRDIIIQQRSGKLQHISELNPSYLSLQYPMLFPFGEDGYHVGILRKGELIVSQSEQKKRTKINMREWFAYRLQERKDEFSTILFGRKLLQQFIVDGYSMVESGRLYYVRNNQGNLRSETYKNIKKANEDGISDVSSVGKRVILLSSFTAGARYMMQNYLDVMALCRTYGHSDLFLTLLAILSGQRL